MELMSAQSVDLETFGEGHKEGQIFLVRLLGCWVLGYGVLCFFLSRIRDSEVQSLVLKGLIISALFVALGSIASPEGWVSLVPFNVGARHEGDVVVDVLPPQLEAGL